MLHSLKCIGLKASTFLFLLLPLQIFASPLENLLTQTQIQDITSNKTWQQLILGYADSNPKCNTLVVS